MHGCLLNWLIPYCEACLRGEHGNCDSGGMGTVCSCPCVPDGTSCCGE